MQDQTCVCVRLCVGTASFGCSSCCTILYMVCVADAMAICGVYSFGVPSCLAGVCASLSASQVSSVYLVHLVWRVPHSSESIHCNKPPPKVTGKPQVAVQLVNPIPWPSLPRLGSISFCPLN